MLNSDIVEGNRMSGYTARRVIPLPDLSCLFYDFEHIATGARHIHIHNHSAENTFSVIFKTVPKDSTGVAHVLEHTVLCGSRKYPVRDPFFSMLKRSLSSFMNAFTASDWTMYPFSTQNRKDYFNLLGVYLDAVFHPNLEILNFKQEGCRLAFELSDTDKTPDHLVYKGIVFNEMKGAMSSPEQVLTRSLFNALFPDTTYAFNSGGDPKDIPRLTHQGLVDFHRYHYHPSNACFYTFGDIPIADTLAFIDKTVLGDYKRIVPDTGVVSQPRWQAPKEKVYSYPLSREDASEKKCQVCIAWLTAEINDHFEVLCLTVLEQILLGNSGSPLRKALIDSGLGTALSDGTGYYSDLRDSVFSCGLKDVTREAAPDIEKIVFSVLDDLVENGIDKRLVRSAIHQIEFHWKEVTNHPYPYGLKLLLSFSGSWLHGGDPIDILNFNKDIERIRKESDKASFFEDRITTYFKDNPHRVRLTLVPDHNQTERENSRLEKELIAICKGLEPSDIARIKDDTVALERLQDAEEDLSSLPTLAIDDIPPGVKTISETTDLKKTSATCYGQPTAGIFYFSAAIGCGALKAEQIPYVPFFCHAFSRIGTELNDYSEMARQIDASTGGIGLSVHARTRFGEDGACLPFISLNAKCLERNEDRMFDILQELLFQYKFSDHGRLKNLLLEYRAGLESMIVPNGHRLAMMLSVRKFSTASWLDETWHGVHQLKFFKKITAALTDDELGRTANALSGIGSALLKSSAVKIALIGESSALTHALSPVEDLRKGLAIGSRNAFAPPEIMPESITDEKFPREGWKTGSAVSFVARAFKAVRMDHQDAPALLVISKLLRSLYLHREIREKGGAYGGFALYNPEDGIFSFASYRDPHVVSTLNVYRAANRFIRSEKITDEDVKEAILQICSDIDRPDPPGPAARKAFYRKIIGLDDDARNRFKQKILSVTRSRVHTVAEQYFDPDTEEYAVAVISGEEKLKAANKEMADAPLTLHRI